MKEGTHEDTITMLERLQEENEELLAEVKRLRKNEGELLSAIEEYQFIEEVTIVDMIKKMKKVLGE